MVKDAMDTGTLELPLEDSERQECEIWTRVMGYFRPVEAFNIGKKSEYADRVCFSEPKAMAKVDEMDTVDRSDNDGE